MVLHKQNGLGLLMIGGICMGWAFYSFATAASLHPILEKTNGAQVQQSILPTEPHQAIAQFLGLFAFGATAVFLGGRHLLKYKEEKKNVITLDFLNVSFNQTPKKMKTRNALLPLLVFVSFSLAAQQPKLWTDSDRKYLLDNLTRSRDELIKETQGLTKAQWEFKEATDRWSINQIVEHIAIWELLLSHDISRGYNAGAKPDRIQTAGPDSTFVNFIYETTPHYSLEYTKPFSYTIPMGIDPLANNLAWFLKMRNESIDFVGKTPDDLRAYFRSTTGSIHQVYIYVFGHTDRHLRQIRKVKQHAKYPK